MKRRDFLKVSGATVGMAGLQPIAPWVRQGRRGRILHYTPVYRSPDTHAEILTHHLPDNIHPILDFSEAWVRVPAGYLPSETIQPMLPPQKSHLPRHFPATLEVYTPYATLHAWGASTAPILARLGHGALIKADQILEDTQRQKWLKIGQIGWLSATSVQVPKLPPCEKGLHAVLAGYNMHIFEYDKLLAQFVVNRPNHLSRGNYPIQQRFLSQDMDHHLGVPWNLQISNGLHLHGITWHHQYGRPSAQVELPLLAAKWLYPSLTHLTIR